MPAYYRAQVVVPNDNGVPKDSIVNTWHYTLTEGTPSQVADATDFEAQLDAFYTAWVPLIGSTDYDWSAIVVKHYDFSESPPRIPFREGTITPGTPPSSSDNLPAEVAICLSMQGPSASGVNMRRRRGRVYCGPLAHASGDYQVPTTGWADIIADAGNAAFFSTGATQLAVYSPYTHHGIPIGGTLTEDDPEVPANLASSFTVVSRLWCDNAWDTQRRRGRGATYRKTYNN